MSSPKISLDDFPTHLELVVAEFVADIKTIHACNDPNFPRYLEPEDWIATFMHWWMHQSYDSGSPKTRSN